MSNGQILESLEIDISQALSKKNLAEDKRLMFKTMQTFVIYLKDDHARIIDMTPKVKEMWECKEQLDKDRRETKKMILSPLYNTIITWIVSTIITILGIHFFR
jgi:hypothetical protein